MKISMLAMLGVAAVAAGSCCSVGSRAIAADLTSSAGRTSRVSTPAPSSMPVQAVNRFNGARSFQSFGQQTRLYAPVAPPYDNSAFRNLGGQPETGGDVILAQGMHGE